jgi:hypothetical protein
MSVLTVFFLEKKYCNNILILFSRVALASLLACVGIKFRPSAPYV